MANDIFNILRNNQSMNSTPSEEGLQANFNQFLTDVNNKYQTKENAMNKIEAMCKARNTTPRDFAIQNLKGQRMSKGHIALFRSFCKLFGESDENINTALNELNFQS